MNKEHVVILSNHQTIKLESKAIPLKVDIILLPFDDIYICGAEADEEVNEKNAKPKK